MGGWQAKRFWAHVTVEPAPGGHAVRLDGRPVRTPAKGALILPTRAMADAVAAEWAAVETLVDPSRMPVTRAANAAIDKVAPQFDEVAGMVAAYGGSDLLCYRAEGDDALCRAQADAWDPMLRWAEVHLHAALVTGTGIRPIAQPPASLARLSAAVGASTPFQLTALHDLVALTGSLVLGLAATRVEFDPEYLWRLSRFDEDWQSRLWGRDEEASVIADLKRRDYLNAWHFWKLSAPSPK